MATKKGTKRKKAQKGKGTENSKGRKQPIKSMSLQIKFWWDDEDKSIHVAMPEKRITTIDCKEGVRKGNARTHGHLFEHLARYLREDGRPAPEL